MSDPSSEPTRLAASLEQTRADLSLSEGMQDLPPRIGRFAILRKLGEGGMGLVYSAYDEELDRRVAIKVVRRAHPDATERMRREAQAMAKLSHPNVAAVYEVGSFEGQLFLAIEFVRGETLGAWGRKQQRRVGEIIEMMAQAGRGLQAAHHAGLVHRDFKPDNVMVGADGRVRVLDFGLADTNDTALQRDPPSMESMRARVLTESPFDTPLTRTGTLMGTPAYMSPEQFRAEPAGPRSDQFSFAVVLYELLYGERPFEGDELTTLSISVTQGKVRPVPRNARVPARVRDIVLRGLSTDPDDRFEDIATLMAELGRVTGVGRRNVRLALGGALAITLAGALPLAWQERQHEARVAACAQEAQTIDEVWNEARRKELSEALAASDITYASAVADKVTPWLDRNAKGWADASERACTQHSVTQQWSEARLDKARWCLDEARLQLDALVKTMSSPDASAVQNAIAAASELARPERCVNEAALTAMPAPPAPADRKRAAALRADVAKARALASEGKYEEGLALAELAREQAEQLDTALLLARALVVEASLMEFTGAYGPAEATATRAFLEAGRAGDWDTAAESANMLVFIVGNRDDRVDEAKTWSKLASLAISLSADPLELREAGRLHNLATIEAETGDHERAKATLARAIAIRERVLGPTHPSVADGLQSLGGILRTVAEYDRSRELLQRALEIRTASFGEDHPRVALSYNALASLYNDIGERERALEYYKKALALREAALGPDHPLVADSLNGLGIWHGKHNDMREAGTYFRRALDILEADLGADHRDLAPHLVNLANVYSKLGDYDQAKTLFERALEINTRTRGPQHARVALTNFNLGLLYYRLGDKAEAEARYRKATAVFEKAYAVDHPRVGFSLNAIGTLMMELGRHEEAVEALERSLAIRSRDNTPASWRAGTEFNLAQALYLAPPGRGRDRDRARALAREARARYVDMGKRESDIAEIDAWMKKHPG